MEQTQDEEDRRGAESSTDRKARRRWTKTRLSLGASAAIIGLVLGVSILYYFYVKHTSSGGNEVSPGDAGADENGSGDAGGDENGSGDTGGDNKPAGEGQKPPYFVAYPHDYNFLVDEPKKCGLLNPFAVLVVPVHPRNRADRDAVRATWAEWTQTEVRNETLSLFFLLGLPAGDGAQRVQRDVLEEAAEHRDILQADFVDSYFNLTVKSMVMFEWLHSRCANASYAVKVDSDVFLNVPNLVDLLLEAPAVNYQTGLLINNARPYRDPNSQWYLPFDIYPQSHLPRFAHGPTYVLSSDLPGKLVATSRHVKAIHLEDVYVALCMKYLDISPSDPPTPGSFQKHVPYSRCAYSKLISTQCSRNNIDRVNNWADFKRPGPHCME